MRNTLPAMLGLCVLQILSIGQAILAADFTAFDAPEREVIDQRVMGQADLRTGEPKKAFYGSLAGWGVARTPLQPEEELELAEGEHQKILKTWKTSPAPPLAVKVLKRLTAYLPNVAPKEFEYSLTIIETPEFRSWTVGGGFLYLSRPMYEAVTQEEDYAQDRLAFVLAHEMGHIVRKHCRSGYQLLKLQTFGQREGLEEVEGSKLKKAIRKVMDRTGNRLRFLYEPDQEYEADLFAAHLCRNAGFEREAGWDILRRGVLTEEAEGDLLRDPAYALLSNANPANEKNRPSASDRLRQLCFERDGVIRGVQYGLWEFEAKADQWIKPRQLRVPANDRVVLLVHGMDSSLSRCYLDLARALVKDRAFRGHRILGFQYPNDASLARVGTFLHRELSDAIDPRGKPIFVGHSAGGLAVRYYAEVKGGPFERIILQGTPNHGSDWARLRPVVELKQFAKDLGEGYSEAVENAILDGRGQIGHDLQPGSLFLNYLNNRRVDRSRYAILSGRRFRGKRMLVLGQALVWGRSLFERKLEFSDAPQILRERALQTLEKLELPEEVRRGDLVVSLKSAKLEGVREVRTFKLSHGKLSRDEEAISATLEILKAEP